LFPSSSEISFPAEPSQHTQTAPQTMQNRTTNNVETHHKIPSNRANNIIQNHEQSLEHKQKTGAFTQKNFFRTQRNRLSQNSLVRGVGFEPKFTGKNMLTVYL
jgi:hypothetical protein